jgi:hypothetical protein
MGNLKNKQKQNHGGDENYPQVVDMQCGNGNEGNLEEIYIPCVEDEGDFEVANVQCACGNEDLALDVRYSFH